MTRFRGIYTCANGRVHVVRPLDECIEQLATGGAIGREVMFRDGLRRWARDELFVTPQTWRQWCAMGMPLWVAKLWETHKFVQDAGWRPDLTPAQRESLALQWVEALASGGLSEIAAARLIVERAREPYSVNVEIVDVSEIPTDRTRRKDWRRSSNGGPIIAPEEDLAA